MLEIRYDNDKIKRFERELRGFPANSLPKVMSRSLNRTADKARTEIARFGSKLLKTKVGSVRSLVYVRHATYKNWYANIKASKFRSNLINLNPVQTPAGVSYTEFGSKKRTVLKHAFIATGPKKGRQVWLRSIYVIGRRKYYNMYTSGPLKEALYIQKGEPFSNFLMRNQSFMQQLKNDSIQRLQKNINDQVRLILKARLPA